MRKLLFPILALLAFACNNDKINIEPPSPNGCTYVDTNVEGFAYQPVPYQLPVLNYRYPTMEIPADNPMTVAGVHLGRFLFYEKRFSGNNTMSCGSCHELNKAFTDGQATSLGIDGMRGRRNAPSLINIGFVRNIEGRNFMWDGRFASLEQQAIAPIEDMVELHADWRDVECKLRNDTIYHRMFRQAFGIRSSREITRDLAVKAVAQFLRSLVSFNSKYDGAFLNNRQPGGFYELSNSEERGHTIFFNDNNGSLIDVGLPSGECNHCHTGPMLSNHAFSNNGLDLAPNLTEFTDLGLGGVTRNLSDNGKFRAVTLRNIALTGPYMHDGRFATLEDVLDHYVDHVKYAPNLDVNLANPNQNGVVLSRTDMTPQQKQDVIRFLRTLTDSSYFNKQEWSDPFR